MHLLKNAYLLYNINRHIKKLLLNYFFITHKNKENNIFIYRNIYSRIIEHVEKISVCLWNNQ
jgi:hypothetical protein